MSQDGSATEAMQKNATQYDGASVSVMDDETFYAVLAAQINADIASDKLKKVKAIEAVFPDMTKDQHEFIANIWRSL